MTGANTEIYFGGRFSREHYLAMRTLQLLFFGGGRGGGGRAVRPRCKAPLILLYITSKFAYMKHLFC